MAKRGGFTCPTCSAKMAIETSVELSPSVRKLYLRCTNTACAEKRTGIIEMGAVIQPSALTFEQHKLDLFMAVVPDSVRDKVKNLILNASGSFC